MEQLATLPGEQGDPPAEEASGVLNKYVYPEFAGWSGERYLKKLLRQILPMALYRTWEIFADHQALGNDCYLGVPRLAEIAGRATRTMEKNLAELCAKHLLVERAERKIVRSADGLLKSRVVVVKDFAGLYALAHEYHEWEQAEEYVPPDRELAELVQREPRLVAKLRRFDNYRRIFYTRLPGPAPLTREEDLWFTDEPQDEEREEQTKEAIYQERGAVAAKDPAREEPKDLAEDSGERITESFQMKMPERKASDSVSFSSSKKALQERAENHVSDASLRETPSERAAAGVPEEPEERRSSDSTVHPFPSSAKTRQAMETMPPPPHIGPVCRTLTQASEGLVNHSVRNAPATGEQTFPARLLARTFLQAIVTPFGDRNPKGSETRVLRIIACERLEEPVETLLCLVRAYVVARDTRAIRPEHCHPQTGQANRMPLFCAMFERFAEARVRNACWDYSWPQVEADIASDTLLALWWSERRDLVREFPGSLSHEQDEEANRPGKRQVDPELLFAEHPPLLPSHRNPRSQTEEQREERAAFAYKVLLRLLRMPIALQDPLILWEHWKCGCPLYHTHAGKEVCALCYPDPNWPEEALALIQSIGEERTATHADQKTTAGGFASLPEEKGREEEKWDEAAGWADREEALAYGTQVLEALSASGYRVEVYLQLLDGRYQVMVRGADGELVCESPEQIAYLIEQAQTGAL